MLTKQTLLHSITILASGHVEVKELNQVLEDEKVISSVPHRGVLDPGDQRIAELLGNQLAGVQAIAAVRAEADALAAELATTKQQLAESLTIIEAQRQAIEKLTPQPPG